MRIFEHAFATALDAFGLPIATATSLYVIVLPRGIFLIRSHTIFWNAVLFGPPVIHPLPLIFLDILLIQPFR